VTKYYEYSNTENWRLSNQNTTKTLDRHELRCSIYLIKDVPVYIRPWFKAKKGGTLALPPSTFQSGEGNCPQLLFPWSDISEVRTADSYGASEFMSVQSFSGVLVAQSSVFCVTVFVIFCHCQPFTNITSWEKELGTITLPTLKSWGWQS
jgi:hypothetical protein